VERDLEQLSLRLQDFAERRDWAQFHSPRNLTLALVGEVGELAAELQWLTDGEVAAALADAAKRARLEDELADVLIYLARLADQCGIDIIAAAHAKVDRNETRYPVERSRGSAAKHSEL
jgi:dCTP diphosphatase